MGEISEAMLNGECCELCGEFFDEAYGYPTRCASCSKEDYPRGRQEAAHPSKPIPPLTKEMQDLGFYRCADYHFQIKLSESLLDYWPTKNKWHFKKQTYKGSWQKLSTFIQQCGVPGNSKLPFNTEFPTSTVFHSTNFFDHRRRGSKDGTGRQVAPIPIPIRLEYWAEPANILILWIGEQIVFKYKFPQSSN